MINSLRAVVGELVAKWREMLNVEYHICADELESTLSALTAEAGKGDRDAFEAWITAAPIEACITRFGPQSSWPGHYRNYAVQLAWESWQSARLALSTATPAGEWVPITSAKQYEEALSAGLHVEFTIIDRDTYDMPACDKEGSGGWVRQSVDDLWCDEGKHRARYPLAASPRGASGEG
jgi:hypothetical protein